MTSDVIAPSPWTIFGCQNGESYSYFVHFEEVMKPHVELYCYYAGLRLFKEAKDRDSHGKVGRFNFDHLIGCKKGIRIIDYVPIMSSGTIILRSWLWVWLMELPKPFSRHLCPLVPRDQSKFAENFM